MRKDLIVRWSLRTINNQFELILVDSSFHQHCGSNILISKSVSVSACVINDNKCLWMERVAIQIAFKNGVNSVPRAIWSVPLIQHNITEKMMQAASCSSNQLKHKILILFIRYFDFLFICFIISFSDIFLNKIDVALFLCGSICGPALQFKWKTKHYSKTRLRLLFNRKRCSKKSKWRQFHAKKKVRNSSSEIGSGGASILCVSLWWSMVSKIDFHPNGNAGPQRRSPVIN